MLHDRWRMEIYLTDLSSYYSLQNYQPSFIFEVILNCFAKMAWPELHYFHMYYLPRIDLLVATHHAIKLSQYFSSGITFFTSPSFCITYHFTVWVSTFNIFTLLENYSKCRIWILAFFINSCPIKTDLSGNNVWPQASGFQKLAKLTIFGIFS